MRGLRKYLTPFAPDQSGAVSVLFELGGIVVICDAGGCTGNVCGFDEPRWFEQKSAIFSAGLRDMDAILGRDDRLVAKLEDAAQKVDATFAAVIGTPVPAVIATDYLALKRMTERKINIPVLTVDTDGMELYDKGEEKAFLELFKTFAVQKYPVDEKRVGILGMTPQDVSDLAAADKIRDLFRQKQDMQAVCYCMGDGLEEVKKASSVSKNIVVSPVAITTAQYLEKIFGTPYEIAYPLVEELLPEIHTFLASGETYTIRYGIGLLMRLYLDDDFRPEYPAMVASVTSEEYYVNMMIAWYFATALAKQWEMCIPYIEERRLSPWVHRKTIQKAVESYRITDEQKAYLKTFR